VVLQRASLRALWWTVPIESLFAKGFAPVASKIRDAPHIEVYLLQVFFFVFSHTIFVLTFAGQGQVPKVFVEGL
jgi:hypothetical protein